MIKNRLSRGYNSRIIQENVKITKVLVYFLPKSLFNKIKEVEKKPNTPFVKIYSHQVCKLF